jgi:hypothetical protein
MNPKLADFNQDTIALLRLIYLAPGLDHRAYAFKALLRPLVEAKLIGYATQNAEHAYGPVNITPSGRAFLREYKLDHFGYEARHANQYPAQMANNAALMEAMTKFTGHYVS